MNLSISQAFLKISLVTILGFGALAQAAPIYECNSDELFMHDSIRNPNRIQSIKVVIEEQDIIIAGRPGLILKGQYTSKNETKEFIISLLGVPEFLGVNMFHAYFTATHTTNSGQEPSNLSLKSFFSKTGSRRAVLNISNQNLAIAGADEDLLINDLFVSCNVIKPSIYLEKNP